MPKLASLAKAIKVIPSLYSRFEINVPKLASLAKAIKVIPSLCLRFGINVPKLASLAKAITVIPRSISALGSMCTLAKAHRKALTQKLCEGVVSAVPPLL